MSRRLWAAGAALAGALCGAAPGWSQSRSSPPALLSGVTYSVQQWTTAEGLPQNSVLDIVVLANGEMWLATFGGLAVFDGVRFDVVDLATDRRLPSSRIVALEPDGPDALWFATQRGHLARLQHGRTVSTVEPPNTSQDALALARDGSGQLLMNLRDGTLWRSDGRSPWVALSGPESSTVPHLSVTSRGSGAAVVWQRQLSFRGTPDRPSEVVPLPHDGMRVFGGSDDRLWLSAGTSLMQYRDGRVQALSVAPPFTTAITAVAAAVDDVVWVASSGEISRLEPRGETWRRVSVPVGLQPGMHVRRLVTDAQGSLWIGTDGQGLFRVSQSPARRISEASVLNAVQGMAADGRGGAFVARSCLEVDHVDSKGAVRRVELGFRHVGRNDIGCGVALASVGSGSALVRLGRYLLRLDGPVGPAQLVSDGLLDDEGPIVVAPDGAIWISSRKSVVQRLVPGQPIQEVARVPAPVASAALAPDGTLWLGGDGFVTHVRGSAVTVYGAEHQVPRGTIRDLVPDGDGRVWMGAYGGGLGLLHDGRVRRFSTEHGLPDNSVSRILRDVRGRLWVSTNRGIAVVDPADLVSAVEGAQTMVLPVLFGPDRGVAEANFGSPAGFAAPDGQLWFSTIEGPVAIDAARFPANALPPDVRILRLTADEVPLSTGARVTVPALTNRIRVEFSVAERLYPEALRFRYRVDGIDRDWVNGGSARTLTWTPPGPGAYRLRLEARSADGLWSVRPALVEVDVLPAWWQRRSLQAAVVLAFVLAAGAAFRWRVRRLRAQHAEQVRVIESQRHAERQVADMRAQLDAVSRVALAGELAASLAHEVRQPLGAMVTNAEAGRRNLQKYVENPAELDAVLRDIVADGLRASGVINGLRGLLRAEERPIIGRVNLSTLVPEVVPLVRREFTDAEVSLRLDLADGLPDVNGVPGQLTQVVVNLMLNACEALKSVSGDRQVTVRTQQRGGSVELGVHDNGPGPSPEIEARIFQPLVTTKPTGLGMGLAICRSIAESHGGRLMAGRPPAGGFELLLTLPAAAGRGEVRS